MEQENVVSSSTDQATTSGTTSSSSVPDFFRNHEDNDNTSGDQDSSFEEPPKRVRGPSKVYDLKASFESTSGALPFLKTFEDSKWTKHRVYAADDGDKHSFFCKTVYGAKCPRRVILHMPAHTTNTLLLVSTDEHLSTSMSSGRTP